VRAELSTDSACGIAVRANPNRHRNIMLTAIPSLLMSPSLAWSRLTTMGTPDHPGDYVASTLAQLRYVRLRRLRREGQRAPVGAAGAGIIDERSYRGFVVACGLTVVNCEEEIGKHWSTTAYFNYPVGPLIGRVLRQFSRPVTITWR
jgi:hypothetical protein